MKPNPRFLHRPASFWAYVRLLSERLGYTRRGTRQVLVPTWPQIHEVLRQQGLDPTELLAAPNRPTPVGRELLAYFSYRARALNNHVKKNLMTAEQAAEEFATLRQRLRPQCPLPLNKQKAAKRKPAYLTGLVNMLIEEGIQGGRCDYDPRQLPLFTQEKKPRYVLSRRVDGAFPGVVNPIAVWEIKEYYYTTTFGSRVADAVYETTLDGTELREIRRETGRPIFHYLFIDAYQTWWEDGKSYLCRLVDLLHMGYLDEVIVGREVLRRLPALVKKWVLLARRHSGS